MIDTGDDETHKNFYSRIKDHINDNLKNFTLIYKKIEEIEKLKKKQLTNLSIFATPEKKHTIIEGKEGKEFFEESSPFERYFFFITKKKDQNIDIDVLRNFVGNIISKGHFDKLVIEICIIMCKYLMGLKENDEIMIKIKNKENEGDFEIKLILKHLKKKLKDKNMEYFNYKNIEIFYSRKFLEVFDGIVNEINAMEENTKKFKKDDVFVLKTEHFFKMEMKNAMSFCSVINFYYNKNMSIYENRRITAKFISLSSSEFYNGCEIFLEGLKEFMLK